MTNTTSIVEFIGMIINNMIVINTPVLNKIKSKGRKIPRISPPFFVLAGIK